MHFTSQRDQRLIWSSKTRGRCCLRACTCNIRTVSATELVLRTCRFISKSTVILQVTGFISKDRLCFNSAAVVNTYTTLPGKQSTSTKPTWGEPWIQFSSKPKRYTSPWEDALKSRNLPKVHIQVSTSRKQYPKTWKMGLIYPVQGTYTFLVESVPAHGWGLEHDDL